METWWCASKGFNNWPNVLSFPFPLPSSLSETHVIVCLSKPVIRLICFPLFTFPYSTSIALIARTTTAVPPHEWFVIRPSSFQSRVSPTHQNFQRWVNQTWTSWHPKSSPRPHAVLKVISSPSDFWYSVCTTTADRPSNPTSRLLFISSNWKRYVFAVHSQSCRYCDTISCDLLLLLTCKRSSCFYCDTMHHYDSFPWCSIMNALWRVQLNQNMSEIVERMPNLLRELVQNMVEAAPRKRPTSQNVAMVRELPSIATITPICSPKLLLFFWSPLTFQLLRFKELPGERMATRTVTFSHDGKNEKGMPETCYHLLLVVVELGLQSQIEMRRTVSVDRHSPLILLFSGRTRLFIYLSLSWPQMSVVSDICSQLLIFTIIPFTWQAGERREFIGMD